MSLDQDTAIRRASLIRKGSVQYNYHIIVQADRYHGLAQITFYLQTMNFQHDLELDFSGHSLEAVIINNFGIEPENEENFIYLPKSCLQKGKNRVSILYQNVYDIDLSGLVSFVDGGEQFLFTDFEPYYANRVFPCFDQPNIKGTMRLAVVAPAKWKAISNESPNPAEAFSQEKYLKSKWIQNKATHLLSKYAEKVGADTNITTFPETKPLSTYLFCFCAGNYQTVTTQQVSTVPMTLYCPPSVVPNLKRYSQFIFDVTIKCMAFFAQKFNTPYPFNKYDQIFIKECHALAMENAGIVTFNEPFLLPKETPTQYDYYYIGLVVSHELSHHWFGNYVTMVWWDDLWLNQSFAQWISCYSIEELLTTLTYKFDSSYLYFRDGKISGYEEDQRNSATHPIRGIVKNTEEAMSIFDGITYEKGASVLKQLTYLVGADNFCQAVSNYFARFAWGNATIDDLLEDIGKVFPGKDINFDDWKKTWLETASLNIFTTNWNPQFNQITLNQSSFDDKNVLRIHKMEISLFTEDGQFTVIADKLIYPVEETIIAYRDLTKSYKAILVNHKDYTFIENIIDPVSLEFFKNNVDKIQDLLTRGLVWYNIRSMVNLSYFPILDYVALIEGKLFQQENNFIFEMILKNLLKCLTGFVPADVGKPLRSKMFGIIYQNLVDIDVASTERIQILSDCYIKFANTEAQIVKLELWLNGTDAGLSNKTLNLDQKWQIVKKIFTLNRQTPSKWLIFEKIRNQDPDQFRIDQLQTICKALVATEAQFDAIYKEFRSSEVSLTEKALKVQGWRNQCHYDWIVNKYRDAYFTDIVELSGKLSYEEFIFFYQNLKPIDDQLADQIARYKDTIAKLEAKGNLEQHCKDLRKIVDDLSQRIKNIAYNSDITTALSQSRADIRFDCIKTESISYNSHIGFVKDSIYYTGMTQITFTLNTVPTFLPLDCICDRIYSFQVNGKKIYPNSSGEFVFIYCDYLVQGQNFISIHYRNKYNNDGLGCMFYLQTVRDPNNQYVYTKFEPYGAHRFFPCFDQPDLKAPITYNIIVPDGWLAAANEKASTDGMAFTVEDYLANAPSKDKTLLNTYLGDKAGKFSVFNPTKPISTYLYCVVAGNYFSIVGKPDQLHNEIPMTLYSIQSYSQSLTRLAPFIFEMTTLSLDLYQTKFKVAYPFSKYDSVFCHEFKSGAMENVGIITFNDTYLYPQQVSLQKMLQFASTIVHQNSHNWFGNYVTMKWWDDLWLNESFADFIAHYCLEQIKDKVTTIPQYDSGWKIFLVRGVAGYREDQITETTHAVRSPVVNTSIASTYFDRITYQKGSATLKQLMFLMGQDNFFFGVQDYFENFGFKNGTIDDFLGKMQKYFTMQTFSLDDWKKSWLLTPSLNTVSVIFDPNDISDEATLTIQQNWYTEVYQTLRYHKTRVAFFKEDATYDVLDVLLTPTATTTLKYKGSNLYKAVLVNVDYWDYFKYTIDEASLEFFKNNLNNIDNVLTRMIIWHDINEQVRDSTILVSDFVAFFKQYIYAQTDDKIFQFQYSFVKDAVNNYISIPQRADFKKQIYDQTLKALLVATKPNRIKLLKDQLTVFANPQDKIQVTQLEEWRNGSSVDLQPFPITGSQGWEVIKIIYSVEDQSEYNVQQKKMKYNDQESFYPGIKAQLTLNTCNTIVADAAELSTVYGYFKAMDLSLDAKASYSQGWNNMLHLDELTTVYKSKYFTDLPLLSRQLISNHFEFFYQNLKPIDDNLQDTIIAYNSIKLQGDDMIGHMKVLTQIRYMYQLRLKLYAFNK